MRRLYYDLHIHSCLSPCGDNDMTPHNLMGMAALAGINVVALTDHNTSRNCAAAGYWASEYGMTFLPGLELNTAEEIHVVCLFSALEQAMAFSDLVYKRMPMVENEEPIFGQQLEMDTQDNVVRHEKKLLITASDITIDEVPSLVERYGGFCFPAHIDRPSYSILASLGDIPPDSEFTAVEIADARLTDKLKVLHPAIQELAVFHNSDAHYLAQIKDASMYIDVPDECTTPADILAFFKNNR